MKIKCPGCSTLLQIPDTAAGKIVKCKCGKQLRAPAAKPAAAGGKPVANPNPGKPRSAPKRPAQPANTRPANTRPAAQPGPAPVTDDMFNELTDADLSPVKAVHRPGASNPYAAPTGNSAKMLNEAAGGVSVSAGPDAPRPKVLWFIGIANGIWVFIYSILALIIGGVVAFLPAVQEQMPEGGESLMYLIAGAMVFSAVLSLITCIVCFSRAKACWYVLLYSYAFGFADRILGVVGDVMGGEVDIAENIGRAVGAILVGAGLWAMVHSEDVRAYYNTMSDSKAKAVIANVAGLLTGAVISGGIVYLVAK